MALDFRRVVSVPLIASLVIPLLAAAPVPRRTESPSRPCACATEPQPLRVVRVKMYNQTQLDEADLASMLDVTNSIWLAYGVIVEPGTGADAVAVVVSGRPTPPPADPGHVVLGDTLFTNGHATPYIHLWPSAAEAVVEGADIGGLSFHARSRGERSAILLQMMGVALAHELAHYLLDTAHHSAAGLLQARLSARELALPEPTRLWLTAEQQRRICPEGAAAGAP